MEFKKVNLGKIKEKLERTGINRPYYIRPDVPLYKVKEGDNYIRILPPVGEMDDFALDVWVHSFLGPERGSYLCVEKTNTLPQLKRRRCVLCDFYRRMQGRNEDLARSLAPRRRSLYWILDVSDKPQSEDPLVFDAPYRQVAEEILMRCIDRRTGEIIDISDVEEGREIIFRMSRQGRRFPEYRGIELGNRYPISLKLAKKVRPLYEVVVVPDEAELIELVDILYDYEVFEGEVGKNGWVSERLSNERVDLDVGGRVVRFSDREMRKSVEFEDERDEEGFEVRKVKDEDRVERSVRKVEGKVRDEGGEDDEDEELMVLRRRFFEDED